MDRSQIALDQDLKTKTRDELRVIAQKLQIKGRSGKTKDELVRLILEQDETLIRRFLRVTWWDRHHNHVYGVTTLIAAVLAVVFWQFPKRENNNNAEEGRLNIVDLDILEAQSGKADQFPKLDVVFRNTGEVAVITEVIFHIRAVYESKTGWQPGAVKASWNYNVRLPILGAGSSVPVAVRQEIPSNGSDRFQFTLGNDAPPTLSAFLFDITVEFVYDEDEKRLHSQPILFIASPASRIDAMNSGGDMWAAHVHNMKIVRLIDGFDGIVSKAAQEWIYEMKNWVPKYVATFEKADLERRRFLAREVGKLGCVGRHALPILREAASAADPELRNAARLSIAKIESAKRDTVPPRIDPEIHTKIRDWDEGLNLREPANNRVNRSGESGGN